MEIRFSEENVGVVFFYKIGVLSSAKTKNLLPWFLYHPAKQNFSS
jgi:hypothetical protein